MKTWYSIRAAAGDKSTAEISIHDEIGYWGVTAKDFIRDLKSLGPVQQINLSIHSPGGEIFDGIAIFNALKNHPATVTATIEGLAASMASVIAMAADTLRMPANAFLMIHNPSGLVIGDAADMKDMAALLDKLRGSLISSYTAKTGKSEADIIAMLDAETWLTGTEAVDQGFADELMDSVKAAASLGRFDTRRFLNMPKTLSPKATSEDEPPPSVPAVPAVEPPVDPPAVVPPPAVEPPAADPPAAASAPAETPPPADPTASAAPPGKGIVAKFIEGVKALAGTDAATTALRAQVSAHEATIATQAARIAELEPKALERDQLEASLETLEAGQQTVATAAANIVGAIGFTAATESQLPPPAPGQGTTPLEQFNAITDPKEANAFYQKHRAELEKKS